MGLVPRMSATVSKYKAVKRRSFCTNCANDSITKGSDRSDFCAVEDMLRWADTSHATNSASSLLKPCSLQKRLASTVPKVEWSPPRPLAMSWNKAAKYNKCGPSNWLKSWLQSGNSCFSSALAKRLKLASTLRMCSSTV